MTALWSYMYCIFLAFLLKGLQESWVFLVEQYFKKFKFVASTLESEMD